MMKKFMNHLRQAERGQSIIILAIAFIVLLGFVGLTTDVSLMFVRYATIRRAVDSASLAAATQMRQGTEEATVAIAAKQFVEFHGLDSVKVLVESCQTLDRLKAGKTQEEEDLIAELCTADQRKLVKVTVQAESPTVFLKLLGWDNFTLQASALSETSALDVVLIMDVSESMLSETTYDDWAKIGMGYAFIPPHVNGDIVPAKGVDGNAFWTNEMLGWQLSTTQGQAEVNNRLWYNFDPNGTGPEAPFATVVPDGSGNEDPDYQVNVYDLGSLAAYDASEGFPADVSVFEPREGCRVRMYPAADLIGPSGRPGRERRASDPADPDNPAFVPLDEMYSSDLGETWNYSGGRFSGFVPTYDYYGCCNDPGAHLSDASGEPVRDSATGYVQLNGGLASDVVNAPDFDFTDLICQPFKGARDAVELFLEKIDFIRGDRVAFVTFDRSAFLINPWNLAGQATGGNHMIDSYSRALATLRRVVGVRAEPNFYLWDDTGAAVSDQAKWAALASETRPINYDSPDGSGTYYNSGAGQPFSANSALYHSYPVKNHCPYDDAALDAPYSLSAGVFGPESLPYGRNEDQYGNTLSWDTFDVGSGLEFRDIPNWFRPRLGYEFWSSCRGTNIGAALREGNNALVDPSTTRRFGAIWVMVLLGDGAAGASDPVRRNGDKLDNPPPNPFNTVGGVIDPIGGQYGFFGVCPFGTRNNPGEIVDDFPEMSTVPLAPTFPYCSDEDPQTRHDCDFRPAKGPEFIQDNDYVVYDSTAISGTGPSSPDDEIAWNQGRGNLYDLDIGDDCPDELYDVDDYARDWADYVALRDPDSPVDELLPTIYTIGFGLTFGDPDNPDRAVVEDYLGEQLLRYIADVGDNNELDNDYYQNFNENGNNLQLTIDGGYGLRGPCQTQVPLVGDSLEGYDILIDNDALDGDEIDEMFEPLPPTVDCGNYFNAPNANELEFVFDSIASKLFTRIAG